MVTGGLEHFVRRLFGDHDFKALALREPSRAIAQYALTQAEQAAATRVCAVLVRPEAMMVWPDKFWF